MCSEAPTSISGTTSICRGSRTILTVEGGVLGTGAVVEWFTGSCGGTAAGTGNSINVLLTQTTTYFVRYSGTCNTTTCASVTVTVNPLPVRTLTGGAANICQNTPYSLSAVEDANYTYQWGRSLFGAPFTSIGSASSQPITESGNYLLTVTNQYGCSDTSMTPINVADYVFEGSLATGDAIQVGRLNRFAVVSTCASPKSCPGTFTTTGNRLYDSYTITNPRNEPVCATIGINSGCGTNIFCTAYSGSYNPNSLCTNYLADPGSSFLISGFYEATIPANGTIVVVVHEVTPGTGCGFYRLTVNVPRDNAIKVTPNDTICVNTPVTLTAPPANSYVWTPGGAVAQAISPTPGIGITTYTVQSGYGNKGCSATLTQNIVANDPSVAPTSISGVPAVCNGGSTTLTVQGGTLGTGSVVEWFRGSCGGTPAGTGNSITVSPAQTTTYYVRYSNNCGATTCASVTVTVADQPSITGVTDGSICAPGGAVPLSATGVGTINWFDSATDGILLNTGTSYSPNITSTTTFYVESQVNAPAAQTLAMAVQSSTFPGNVRGYWFTAPDDFVITSLLVPTTASLASQSIAVLKFDNNTPPPVFSSSTNAFTTLFLTRANASPGKILCNIPVKAGEVIGILGNRGGLNSYAPGDYKTTIFGKDVQLERLGMQFSLQTTNPRDVWREFGPTTSISRIEFEYTSVACVSSPRVPVTATVFPLPVVATSPSSQTTCAGNTVTFTAKGSGSGSMTVRWQRAAAGSMTFTDIANTSAAYTTDTDVTYTTPTLSATDDGAKYRAIFTSNFTNCSTEAITTEATLTVKTLSTAPTSITGTSTICNGNSTTLTLQGGSAGTGAVAEWFTGSCGGTSAGTGNSITVSPTQTTTYYVRYSGDCNTTTCASLTVTVNTLSTAPASIAGTSTICNGNSTTLTLQGGSAGTGAVAEWFTGSCGGTSAGTGNSITVSPTQTTTYFVRYSGTCNTTTCASVTVTVNMLSTAPTSITGTSTICNGNSTTLTLQGGSAGTGAVAEWFTGSCGGTAAGTGNSITVSPTQTTTYFVRYSGICNTTTCASVTVTVKTLSTAPTSISGTTTICNGNSTTLTLQGGSVGTGAVAQWFTGSCGGTAVGTGNSITVSPTQTTNYYVRYSGDCNTTTCASVTVTVNTLSTAPTSIGGTTIICNGNSTTLTVQGGSAGTGAVAEWFTGSCGGTSAGTGNSITVSPTQTTTYFVRYSGICNTTTCVSVTVTVKTLSTAPTSITGNTDICSGTSTTLTVQGGSLGTGAGIQWFSGSCGGTAVGTGNSITVSPTQTTTYFVRYSGDCNTTTCASVTVRTYTSPVIISGTTATPCQGAVVNLTARALGLGLSVRWERRNPGEANFSPAVVRTIPSVAADGTASLTIEVNPSDNGAQFRAVFKSNCSNNETPSNPATVTYQENQNVPTPTPSNSTISCGQSATLSIPSGSTVLRWEQTTENPDIRKVVVFNAIPNSAGLNSITLSNLLQTVYVRAILSFPDCQSGNTATPKAVVNVSCQSGSSGTRHLAEAIIFPNPAEGEINVAFDFTEQSGTIEMTIMDVSGRRLIQKQFEVSKGQNILNCLTSHLSSGMFYVRLNDQNGLSQTLKFVKE
ncbi:MAG: T9SS type A sorting domain-containing protein [Saprospiraceae bacterium]|nr:T9SS type A sorting domain-containing protein [Saprospiraceae bacterium]